IDELGPLELIHNQGFTEALTILDAGYYHAVLLAIRPSLVDAAQRRWGSAEIIDLGSADH
ncbi:MAG: hypothetical protein LBU48_00585, partial [Coriobacteriales bacterium]|nr:hypothetical protein [Coriobacteriales bacterium]